MPHRRRLWESCAVMTSLQDGWPSDVGSSFVLLVTSHLRVDADYLHLRKYKRAIAHFRRPTPLGPVSDFKPKASKSEDFKDSVTMFWSVTYPLVSGTRESTLTFRSRLQLSRWRHALGRRAFDFSKASSQNPFGDTNVSCASEKFYEEKVNRTCWYHLI